MYTLTNFKTKKALKEALAAGQQIRVWQPRPFPGAMDGKVALEGPHYPEPHTWCAQAIIKNGFVVSIK